MEYFTKHDIEGCLKYIHKDITSWQNGQELPIDYEMGVNLLKMNTNIETIYYKIDPVNIKIIGSVALVHYYYKEIYKEEGKEKLNRAKFTDTFIKENGIWISIGGHGGTI